jgi:hypothetical protein
MDDTVACPGCEAQLVLPALPVGQTAQCPRCRRVFEPTRGRSRPITTTTSTVVAMDAPPSMAKSTVVGMDVPVGPMVTRPPLPLGGNRRAILAMILIGVVCFFYSLQLCLQVEQSWLLFELDNLPVGRFADPVRHGLLENRLFKAENIAAVVHRFLNLAFWPALIVYLLWLYQASRNLSRLSADGLTHTPGWAVGAYFVPIANLIRPCQEMQEIWRASDPENIENSVAWQVSRSSSIVRLWWFALLLAGALSMFAHYRKEVAGGFLQDQNDLRIQILVSLAMLVAGVLLILIIRSIRQRQRERYKRLYGERA